MKILMVRWRSGGRGLRLSRFAWRLPARQLGFVLLTASLAGIAFAQGSALVVERNGRVISLVPYAANILRVTMSNDKVTATGAPGYGFVATPSTEGWTHEHDADGGAVFRSPRMVVRLAPGNLPAEKLPQPMPLDALNRQLRDPYFGGGGEQGLHTTMRFWLRRRTARC
jgi:alpha-D-xyloside xylohydrolase